MARFCLIGEQVDKFKRAFSDGTLDPDKLVNSSSAERNKMLSQVLGEDATETNRFIESKILLINQKRGILNAVKRLTGLDADQTAKLAETARKRLEKIDEYMNPDDQDKFLADLAADKVAKTHKIAATSEQVAEITKLSRDIDKASHDVGADGISEYGRKKVELDKYLESATPSKKGAGEVLANIVSIQRAVQTSLDVSAIGRQGGAYIGRKEWFGAVKRMMGYMKSQDNLDKLAMQMYSNPKWDIISKYSRDLGLTNLGVKMSEREEAFASKMLGKIPGVGVSERAYTGFLSDLRYNRFNNILNTLEKNGVEVTDETMEALAKTISTYTGRGTLGDFEPAAKSLATALFSPRWLASKFEVVTRLKQADPIARKEAAKGLATLAGLSVGMITALKASGANVEVSPYSSDFGKLKFGNNRIDLTFGQGQYIRAITQMATGKYKSTTTGEMKDLNTGEFGGRTSLDVAQDFVKGKASPLASLIIDFAGHQDRDQNKLGIDWNNLYAEKNINSIARVIDMFKPMIASSTLDAYYDAVGNDKNGLNAALTALGTEMFGISTQTYGEQTQTAKNVGADARPLWKKLIKMPVEVSPDFSSILGKMTEEKASISVPGSKTTITEKGKKDSRVMTKQELEEYREIYKTNINKTLKQNESNLSKKTGEDYTKLLDKLKRETTEKSKNELIKKMIK